MIKCDYCGKFIGYGEGRLYHYTPDSEFGPEKEEFICKRCWEKEEEVVD
jgi:hypothetical protein